MPDRHEYRLDLTTWQRPDEVELPGGVEIRPPSEADAEALAELMLDAYLGTIDCPEDATIQDAREGLQEEYLQGVVGKPMLDCSRICFSGELLLSACLLGLWEKRDCPMVNFIMTRAEWKRRGLARAALLAATDALVAAGHTEVRAVATVGNTASESLFEGLGYERL